MKHDKTSAIGKFLLVAALQLLATSAFADRFTTSSTAFNMSCNMARLSAFQTVRSSCGSQYDGVEALNWSGCSPQFGGYNITVTGNCAHRYVDNATQMVTYDFVEAQSCDAAQSIVNQKLAAGCLPAYGSDGVAHAPFSSGVVGTDTGYNDCKIFYWMSCAPLDRFAANTDNTLENAWRMARATPPGEAGKAEGDMRRVKSLFDREAVSLLESPPSRIAPGARALD